MRKALGKGLEALIPKAATTTIDAKEPARIPINKIRPNHLQPRKHFDPEQLGALAASIREHGLAQPILVSFDPDTNSYELIAGERRLRAAELAGFTEIEAVLRSPASDKERLSLALIENLQREDLSPIDAALGYLRLMKESVINQTQLASVMGKSKSAVSNTLRLLELPENIQKSLQSGKLSEGHARALLMIENSAEKQRIFCIIQEQNLSVRESEDLARGSTLGPRKTRARRLDTRTADIRALESSLQQRLGIKVEIRTKKDPSAGKIILHFYSLTDLDKVVNLINL